MATRFSELQATYRRWVSTKPAYVRKMLGGAYAVAVWGVIITICAALFVSGGKSAQEQLNAPIWVRIIMWVLGAAVLVWIAAVVYTIARLAIVHFLGAGDEREGWKRLAISALILWLGLKALHLVAFEVWTMTPFAAEQQRLAARYTDLCTVEVQDSENSGHFEADWHAGAYVCAPLQRRLHALYPGPEWLFGPPL